MSEAYVKALSWVAACSADDSEHEIFFRGQDVVDALRHTAEFHAEKSKLADESFKKLTHAGLSALLTIEADEYDVAIMQALLDHEAGDAHEEEDGDG